MSARLGLIDLAVAGKSIIESTHTNIQYPTTTKTKAQQSKTTLDYRKRLVYYLPWIKQSFIRNNPSDEDNMVCDTGFSMVTLAKLCPQLVSKKYKFISEEDLFELVGQALNLPEQNPRLRTQPGSDVIPNAGDTIMIESPKCTVCLCDVRTRGKKECGNSKHNHDLGRHQACICECYCHLKPSEMRLVSMVAKAGNTKILEQLIKSGENPQEEDLLGNSAIHHAATHGHIGVVSLLLANNVSSNKQNINGNTPLHVASRYGHLGVVALLLKHSCNINAINKDSETALHVATKNNHMTLVNHLLRHKKVVPNMADSDGNTALHMSLAHSDLSVMNLLINNKSIDVNCRNVEGQTPLHLAAKIGRCDAIRALLSDPQTELSARDNDGNTPLHLAVKFGNGEAVHLLLAVSEVLKRGHLQNSLSAAAEGSQEISYAKTVAYREMEGEKLSIEIARTLRSLVDIEARNGEGQTALHTAIANNSGIDVINQLLMFGSDLSAKDSLGNNPLHTSVFRGNFILAKRLLMSPNVDPNATNIMGRSALHIATSLNDVSLVKLLLKSGADPDVEDRDKRTPLHLAVEKGSMEMAMCIVQHNADIMKVDYKGLSPFELCLKLGKYNLAENLAKKCSDTILKRRVQGGNTMLHTAVKYGNKKLARILLNRNVPMTAQNSVGNTILHEACKRKDYKLANIIIDFADEHNQTAELREKRNIAGKTALHVAAKSGDSRSTNRLLEKGAHVNSQDIRGRSPLHLSPLCTDDKESLAIATMLVENSANINLADNNGNTPLHAAASNGKDKIVSLLLDNGAEIDQMNDANETPLFVSCKSGNEESVNLLISRGADLFHITADGSSMMHSASAAGNMLAVSKLYERGVSPIMMNAEGLSPAHIAAENDQDIVIDYLAQVGVDLTQRDKKGRTPLHLASARGNKRAVLALLLAGSPINLADDEGRTSLHYACKEGHAEVIEMLQENGGDMDQPDSHGVTPSTLYSEYIENVNKPSKDQKSQTPSEASQSSHERKVTVTVPSDHMDDEIRSWQAEQFVAANDKSGGMITSTHPQEDDNIYRKELPPLPPLSPADLVTTLTYRTSLPEIFQIRRQSVAPPLHESPLLPSQLAGGEDVLEDGTTPSAPLIELPAQINNEKEQTIGDTITELSNEVGPQTKLTVFPNFYVPKSRSFATKQTNNKTERKTSIDDQAEQKSGEKRSLHIALNFVKHLASGRTVTPISAEDEDLRSSSVSSYSTCSDEEGSTEDSDESYDKLDPPSHNYIKAKSVSFAPEVNFCGDTASLTGCTAEGIIHLPSLGYGDGIRLGSSEQEDNYIPIQSNLSESGKSAGEVTSQGTTNTRLSLPTVASLLMTRLSSANSVLTEERPVQDNSIHSLQQRQPTIILPDTTETANQEQISNQQPSPSPSPIRRLPTLSPQPPGSPSTRSKSRLSSHSSQSERPLPDVKDVREPQNVDLSKSYTQKIKQKKKSIRRPGQLLLEASSRADNSTSSSVTDTPKKKWIFDDDSSADLTETPDTRSDSEMSFDIHIRTPTPDQLEITGGDNTELTDAEATKNKENMKDLMIDQAKKAWGKLQRDTKFREEIERQRLAEERKKKSMRMRLARAQIKDSKIRYKGKIETLSDDLSEYDWLAQYCIYSRGSVEIYRKVFNALIGSAGEKPEYTDRLHMSEMLMALMSCNRELKSVERHYVLRVGELLGYDMAKGCDFRHFSILAALSQKITALDAYIKNVYKALDMKNLDARTFFFKKLWKAARDPDTNMMSKEKLIIELRAGGISMQHIQEVEKSVLSKRSQLDFLDFLTYIPLFLYIHDSVIRNPLDDSMIR